MTVSEMQARRKAAEREPIAWDVYRAALIESGMVADARQRREVLIVPRSYAVVVSPDKPKFEYEPMPGDGHVFDDMLRAMGHKDEPRTLIDRLWADKHGVAEDWRQAQAEPEP